jgi:hypothetical protein
VEALRLREPGVVDRRFLQRDAVKGSPRRYAGPALVTAVLSSVS